MYFTPNLIVFVVLNCVKVVLLCSNDGYPFEYYLSTMTPYRTVSNKDFYKIHYDGCEPKKAWMVVRHGTRNPKATTIVGMKERLPLIKQKILESNNFPNEYVKNRDLDLFKKWKPSVDPKDEKKLAHEGEEEMLLLAERMQTRFPHVFDNVYSNTTYKFKYTYSQRTQKSAYYFARGLFGKLTAKSVYYPEPSKQDPILRFYKLCEKWNKNIKKNPEALLEKKLFENGSEMKQTVNNINQRLGFKSFLTADDVTLMYHTCAFETAWNKKSKSPWCAVFNVDDLKVLEYVEDLKMYWQDGYGYEISYKQACPAFGDMINFLEAKDPHSKVTVYFTHSGTLLKMLAHLGLYKDEQPLTSESFSKMTNRQWKTSKIDSFATNLAFVLFGCKEGDKVLTLHQERVVRLPSCPNSDLCSINQINKYYANSIQGCDFETLCSM
ncbi:unnamed protein product [Callosobruchus maculatus]|uniref:Multiple inositol polyphosphate phosphatase 1 n=2 Tax=Callosobruchus maculatus TaxID=64391 RepID=A0A653DGB2_CALMS|nr:unnamed protein product [Callosobruchus maculatus]